MAQSLELTVKTSILHKQTTLNITPEFIEYNNTNLSKFEIAEIRYGVGAIRGYSFNIGRAYCIDIKSLSGNIIKIRFKSVYGIRKTKLNEKYSLILKALFENFINDIIQNVINKYYDKVDFDILGITITQDGILFNSKSELIPWNDVGTKNYRSYYSIFSKPEPSKYKTFAYLTDWNTCVVYSVSRYILKIKNLL